MAGSLNKATLIGRLGADPEARRLPSGDPVVNFTLATSEQWRDKQSGERKERTEWHRVTVFNQGAAKFAEQYLKKGDLVYVEGKLVTRKWQDQGGNDRYTTEVHIVAFNGILQQLAGKGGDKDSSGQSQGGSNRTSEQGAGSQSSRDLDDEIPF